jgi:DnaJ-domain-containing protein 1
MSLPRRILKVAGRKVLESLGLREGFRNTKDEAAEELEEFLRNPAPPRTESTYRPPQTERPPRQETPPQGSHHPYEQEYRLLGAAVGSDLETVRRCWRKLARENHPDRFTEDPVAQRRAHDRLVRINEAYERLRQYLEWKDRQ